SATAASSFTLYSMVLFAVARFVCTFLLKYVRPGALLMVLAVGAIGLLVPVMFVGGIVGLWALVGVSGCMSLMFPTIYGIALDRVGDDAKLGAAGLVMAIAGGSIMPPLQGYLIDTWSLNLSFVLPAVCFVVIAIYGLFTSKPEAPVATAAA
ncbi:MAG: MFS transporter, partial [Rhodopirellula bahusiensis]